MDISSLYNSRGDLLAGIESIEFYQKRNLISLYNFIQSKTSFLDEYKPSMKERIFYIKNNILDTQKCTYCNVKKRQYHINTKSLTVTCGERSCKIKSSIRYRNTDHLYLEKLCPCGNTFKVSIKTNPNKSYCNRNCYFKFKVYTHSVETRIKISDSNKRVHSDPIWRKSKQHIYDQSYKKISATMKRKISEGTFTPCITNSWTKWNAEVNINGQTKKFRSFWEASFYVLNEHLEFEKIRIPYVFDTETHNYIVDFVDVNKKILYEIKPDTTKSNRLNECKFQAAIEWANNNGYTFVVISDDWFKMNAKNIDYSVHPQLYKSMKQFL